MKWVKGRLGTGYEKLLLCQLKWPIKFDIYIIRLKEGNRIPVHFDKVENYFHFRLNIILKKAKIGGNYIGESIYQNNRLIYFRPDIMEHSVSEVFRGERYIFSI